MAGTDLFNATHANPRVLVSQQMPDNAEDTVYAVSGTGSTVLKHGTICNISVAAVIVSMSIMKSGQAIGSTQHRLLHQYSLAAGDTLSLRDFIADCCLGPGDFITVTAGTANTIDVIISGVEYI